jgi:hypothetical protein
MNTTAALQHQLPDRPREAEQISPPSWVWSTPATEAGECRHGISNPDWCAICNPAPAAKDRNR